MNRSLPNVILGNWAAKAPSVTAATGEKLEHQEIDAPSAAEVWRRQHLRDAVCLFSELPFGQLLSGVMHAHQQAGV